MFVKRRSDGSLKLLNSIRGSADNESKWLKRRYYEALNLANIYIPANLGTFFASVGDYYFHHKHQLNQNNAGMYFISKLNNDKICARKINDATIECHSTTVLPGFDTEDQATEFSNFCANARFPSSLLFITSERVLNAAQLSDNEKKELAIKVSKFETLLWSHLPDAAQWKNVKKGNFFYTYEPDSYEADSYFVELNIVSSIDKINDKLQMLSYNYGTRRTRSTSFPIKTYETEEEAKLLYNLIGVQ